VACSSQGERKVDTILEWEGVPLQYARMFAVQARGEDRLVHLFDSAEEGRDTLATYFLSPNGTNSDVITPVQRIATTSTTHVPFFKSLQGLEQLVGCAYLTHVMDTTVLGLIDQGKIMELSDGNQIDKERLLIATPDIVLAFPFGNGTDMVKSTFNGPVLSVTEYLEPHPLGRVEWIKFFGMLLNKEEQAEELFTRIAQRYDSIKDRANRETDRPGVFFGSYWQGEWHASGGGSYMARITQHAGGKYLFDDHEGTANVSVSLEELVARSRQADYFGTVFYAEHAVRVNDMLGEDERLRQLVSKHGLKLFYGNTATVDLFGQAIVEPDVLLADFTAIIHDTPDSLHALKYFSRFTD